MTEPKFRAWDRPAPLQPVEAKDNIAALAGIVLAFLTVGGGSLLVSLIAVLLGVVALVLRACGFRDDWRLAVTAIVLGAVSSTSAWFVLSSLIIW